MAKKQSLEQIEASLSRWKTRLRRAMTAIDKLEKQSKRLTKAKMTAAETLAEPVLRKVAGMPKGDGAALVSASPARGSSDETAHEKPSPVNAPVPPAPVALAERDDDIPAFLRRQKPGNPIGDQIKAEIEEKKKAKARGRIATMKAKQSGDTRKMPLTGKAALAAIRG
jgi:hypothetical protein